MANEAAGRIRCALVTGQSSKWHNWRVSHAVLGRLLEESGLFEVEVVATPPSGAEMAGFAPNWEDYAVAVIDYEGDDWPEATRASFERFVSGGGGVVVFHATDNAFPGWKAWNEMIAVGGWGGRDESCGSKLRWRGGQAVTDDSPGVAYHPAAYRFEVTAREPEHPILRGLPPVWLHGHDELYSQLRGPAKNVSVLATARADPALVEGGSGEDEPMLMAVRFGEGRIFHTALGHVGAKDESAPESLRCVGFATTFLRGTEWAATGRVTQGAPMGFPGLASVSLAKT